MTSIRFVNHASVVITRDDVSLLSDPWYTGTAFHEGWSLLYENEKEDILNVINEITHIWISHEHPDHFSIPFFKRCFRQLKERKIKILFQKTKDKRVFKYLNSLGLDVQELENKKTYFLSKNFKIKCVKNGFYDSALLFEIEGKKIFNLNDCPIHEIEEIKKFQKENGSCDVLLTQFSYAAWKGGKENLIWRQQAAEEKVDTIINQALIFSAKIVIPFASFIRFSNTMNHYLNDSINTTDILIKKIQQNNFKLFFLKPMEKQNLNEISQNPSSIEFWKKKYNDINNQSLITYQKNTTIEELQKLYEEYIKRIFKKNAYWMVWLASKLKIFGSFQKVNIFIKDINTTIILDLLSKNLIITKEEPHLIMNSESIKFIFLNNFGFDTLTVNGCFEENKKNGFVRASKALAIENLNNLGIFINPKIIFRLDLFFLYLKLLSKVKKKLQKNNN